MEHAAESTKQKWRPPGKGPDARPASIEEPPLHPILQLQRQVGNQAVLAMLRSGALQAKLKVGSVDDPLEHEADRVATQVMRMTDPALSIAAAPPQISRKCSACEEEDKAKMLQTKPAGSAEPAASEAPSIVHDVIRASGEPLHASARAFFEPRFGRDLSDVRIHTDTRAAQSARAVDALAYTLGTHIVFSSGQHAPDSSAGLRLLAHELTHVVQQSSTASAGHPSAGLDSKGAAPKKIAPLLLQRSCLPDADCAKPSTGEPGGMIEKGQQERQASQQANPNRPGNGRRAVKLEEFARNNGVSLAKVVGLFVDLDFPSGWGAVTGGCGTIPSEKVAPNAWCTFVPEDLELEAGQFLDNPTLATIGKMDRELWRVRAIETLTHEQQHAAFGQVVHPSTASCAQDTKIAGTKNSTVGSYLSELSAILSAFQIEFRALRSSPNPGPIWNSTKAYFDYNVLTATENISGVLHALRCNCNCADVEFLVRDTFEFTTKGWSRADRVLFNSIMNRFYPAVAWPLSGDPFCIDDCEMRFDECLKSGTGSSGVFLLPGADVGQTCIAHRSSCFQSCQSA